MRKMSEKKHWYVDDAMRRPIFYLIVTDYTISQLK